MDVKELQETRCCSKCVNCFDEYDHYKSMKLLPYDQPHADHKRFYCNKEHKYVLPYSIKTCFTEW